MVNRGLTTVCARSRWCVNVSCRRPNPKMARLKHDCRTSRPDDSVERRPCSNRRCLQLRAIDQRSVVYQWDEMYPAGGRYRHCLPFSSCVDSKTHWHSRCRTTTLPFLHRWCGSEKQAPRGGPSDIPWRVSRSAGLRVARAFARYASCGGHDRSELRNQRPVNEGYPARDARAVGVAAASDVEV